MKAIITYFRYLVEVFDTGDALNDIVNALPFEIQEHAVAIGEWILAQMGGG